MPWIFAYGPWTDPDQMRDVVGKWTYCRKSTLQDHVFLFSKNHLGFGGTSSMVPLEGGMVLGVAYLIDDDQVRRIVENGHGYVLKENRALVDGEEVPVLILVPEQCGRPEPPSDSYLAQVRHGLGQHYPARLVEAYLGRALKRSNGQELVERLVPSPEGVTAEYGCDFRRLFPWPATRTTRFGAAWALVRPDMSTTPHSHDEEEAFIFVSGAGRMRVDGHEFPVSRGDVVYLEPFAAHTALNTGDTPLEILCVWWGGLSDAEAAAESDQLTEPRD
jgi:mannose-6-phosphate isomerase-like protein (cupin superfamily)